MNMEQLLRNKLEAAFEPTLLEIENESSQHSGPATESHFKLTLVSPSFTGLSRVKRHQQVYGALKEEMAGPIHALAMHLYDPEEWQQGPGAAPASPDCRGGSKRG
jgi:BolA protein